jgi:hypothetical protein
LWVSLLAGRRNAYIAKKRNEGLREKGKKIMLWTSKYKRNPWLKEMREVLYSFHKKIFMQVYIICAIINR